jgi:hypothetical protein
MEEKFLELINNLTDTIRDLSFDVNFCLALLKEDEEIAKFYDRCKKRYDEQINKKEE